ncbi:ABC transporter substrate-binding protein [Paracoccus denitrificans]|uniref:ABC transporter substrate-binding protein n=1 Tax=Paracoccus denitrificans TaxID=266 RepID=UPI000CEC2A29|nr:ABC transporter substrate-binding protein [Paracoccus denitrificans]
MVMRWLLAACLAGGLAVCAKAEPPQRVLSMNLCTDQLAMLLAAPGQLISVSYLAQDPRASVMAEEAMTYDVNHGLAEEIFLLQPDLVLAGSFTTPATTALLRRLGKPVEVFAAENDFDDIRTNISRMGQLLGREAEARAMTERFDADLAALTAPAGQSRPRAAMYTANGYSSGPDSLSGQIIEAAGFDNIGAEFGLGAGGIVPLEVLLLSDPDLVITGSPYPGASRAEEVLDHPALRMLKSRSSSEVISDRDWVCGTPRILDAIRDLAAARHVINAQTRQSHDVEK